MSNLEPSNIFTEVNKHHAKKQHKGTKPTHLNKDDKPLKEELNPDLLKMNEEGFAKEKPDNLKKNHHYSYVPKEKHNGRKYDKISGTGYGREIKKDGKGNKFTWGDPDAYAQEEANEFMIEGETMHLDEQELKNSGKLINLF